MSTQKLCADYLRLMHRNLTGSTLGSGHAHEIIAAYFGYKSGAALRAEKKYPLSDIHDAQILIPDLTLIDQRQKELKGLSSQHMSSDEIAMHISSYLQNSGIFTGEVWLTRDLKEQIESFIQSDPMLIEDSLSGEMATTNAFFDELYIEDIDINIGDDTLSATINGSLNGESDPDRIFYGDSISFETVMTLQRVSGRIAYARPELETSGSVDDSHYDGDHESASQETAESSDMPTMTDPTDGMKSFQQALLDGEIDVAPGQVDPNVFMHLDKPEGTVRLTYVRMASKKIIKSFAIFVPVEPIDGMPTFQVGYAVPEQFRGQGLAKDIVEAGIAELKQGLRRQGLRTFWVEAIVGTDNEASKKVCEATLSKRGKLTTDKLSGLPAIQYTRKFS